MDHQSLELSFAPLERTCVTVRTFPLKGDLNPTWDHKSLKLQLSLKITLTGHSLVVWGLASDLSNFTAGLPPYFSGSVSPHFLDRSLEKKLSRAFAPREHAVATLWPSRL